MKFLSEVEAKEWAKSLNIELSEKSRDIDPRGDFQKYRVEIPKRYPRLFWFSEAIEHTLRPWRQSLLWVTQSGIWESSENWNLFYRLRGSYEETRLLHEAPAHLFVADEFGDLISYIQLAINAGWDFRLLAEDDHCRIFVSHDEWIEVAMRDAAELRKQIESWEKSGVKRLS